MNPRVAALLLVTALGCGSDRNEAPAPAVVDDDSDASIELPPSMLGVPIVYDLSSIAEKLEDVVPLEYGNLNDTIRVPGNDRLTIALSARRDPFRVQLDGLTARVASVIHYRVRAWYDPPIGPTISASCGTGENDPPKRVSVAVTSPLDLTADWTLSSKARVGRVAPLTDDDRDRCRVTFLNIDVTDRLVAAARGLLTERLDDIDRAVAGIDVRSNFVEWWDLIRTPIELTDSVWLAINPIAVTKGLTSGEGLMLTANVGLTAAPRIVIGTRPAILARPLPQLDTGQVGDGLHILVDGIFDYETASSLLAEELRGREFTGAGQRVHIADVGLSGIGAGRLSLRVDFEGSVNGRLFLVGTPQFDPDSRQVHVPDLDFDVASEGVFLRSLAWIGRDRVVTFLRDRARFPIGDPVRLGERYLAEGLNRNLSDDVRLSGEVLSVAPVAVHATRRVLLVRAHARAKAMLTIIEKSDTATAR